MRNPLGSPDVMGFNTGAWSGVLVAMVLFGQDLTAIALSAMVGGIVTSLLVWLLAWRNGIDTFRLIIIGIGVRAMLVAFNLLAVAESVFRNGANSGFVECRIAQRPDVGKNLAFHTHHYIDALPPPCWCGECACWRWAMIPPARWASASNVRVC